VARCRTKDPERFAPLHDTSGQRQQKRSAPLGGLTVGDMISSDAGGFCFNGNGQDANIRIWAVFQWAPKTRHRWARQDQPLETNA
jgi:hypothetical protein